MSILGILPSEAKVMREEELERKKQIEKMRQKIRVREWESVCDRTLTSASESGG